MGSILRAIRGDVPKDCLVRRGFKGQLLFYPNVRGSAMVRIDGNGNLAAGCVTFPFRVDFSVYTLNNAAFTISLNNKGVNKNNPSKKIHTKGTHWSPLKPEKLSIGVSVYHNSDDKVKGHIVDFRYKGDWYSLTCPKVESNKIEMADWYTEYYKKENTTEDIYWYFVDKAWWDYSSFVDMKENMVFINTSIGNGTHLDKAGNAKNYLIASGKKLH